MRSIINGGGVAQWLACLTISQWMPVSCDVEPQQRLPLFS